MHAFEELKARLPAAKLDLSFATQNGRQILTLKAELDGTEVQVDSQPPPRPATTFHQFRKLPREIQWRVWELSFPEPRIFRLADENNKTWTPVTLSHKPPGAAQACKLSRLVYNKEMKYALGSCGGPYKSLQILPSRDVFYWDQDEFDETTLSLWEEGLKPFKNVAVNLPKDRDDLRDLFGRISASQIDLGLLGLFDRVERVIFVLEHNLPSDTDVVFLDVHEKTTMQYDGHVLSCIPMLRKLRRDLFYAFPAPAAVLRNLRLVEATRAQARRV
ncbi:hypothetical protein SNK03_001234 [Fusarium graminearum]